MGTVSNVVLTWTPPSAVGPTGPVVSFNVYRAPATGGAVVQIAKALPAATLTYSDPIVDLVAGTAYRYWVTCVDASGNESGPAQAGSISIPFVATVGPNPPADASVALQ